MLDALEAGDIVAACHQVGAEGAFAYVWRGGDVGDWSTLKVQELRNAGLAVIPVAVPAGNDSTPLQQILDAAKAFGFGEGPLVFDLESPGNLPSGYWWTRAINGSRQAGFRPILYGNRGDVGGYDKADGWWLADYVQQSVEPVPQLPLGEAGWQYANQVQINGRTYDCSVIDAAIFGGSEVLDPNDPVVKDIQAQLGRIEYGLIPAPPDALGAQGELTLRLRDIQAKVDAPGGPVPGSPTALQIATALEAMAASLRGS